MTDAERILWKALRDRQVEGLKFKRQYPKGPYVLDFFCEQLLLAIEVDGGQHAAEKDARRTLWLADQGIRILRFWNIDVLTNLSGVLETISVEALNSNKERQ